MGRNRQYSDYANADTEWAAYQNAVSAGFALLQGNPDHTKMFANVNAPDGSENAYYTAVQNIEAAIAALDAKAVTDTAKLAALETVVNTYNNVDPDDYKLYTYDRFEDAYDRAANIVNSQVAPEGEEATFVAPAVAEFDIVYAKAQLELWGGRLLKKVPVKTYLAEALSVANGLVEANYTSESWAAFKVARDTATTVNGDTSATLLQTTINDARIELLKKQYDLVEVSAPLYLTPVTSAVITDSYIYIIVGNTTSITAHVTADAGYDVYCSTTNVGTGSVVTVEDTDMNIVATYTVILYGDINGDGEIGGTADLSAITNHINGTNTLAADSIYFEAADVNFDGVVDASDRTAIISGNITQNPNA